MNLLNSILYDPASAVTKATSANLAMTAFDTANLRLNVTVPASGIVMFRLQCIHQGGITFAQILLGVLQGATVVCRVAPVAVMGGTGAATTNVVCRAEVVVSGLTPGATDFDAAYAVETAVASTAIKYGGPNDTTSNNAYGGFVFEAWDPQLVYPTNFGLLVIDGSGRVDVSKLAGQTVNAAGAVTFPGTVASSTNVTGVTLANGAITSAACADGFLTTAKLGAGFFDAVWSVGARSLTTFGTLVADVATAVWGATTRILTAGTNIVLAKGTGVTGFNDLSAAQVNAEADTVLSDAGVTPTRTGYLDKLNISGNVAGSSEVTAIQNNTRVVRVVPEIIEKPDSGTQTYRIELLAYDSVGNMEAPDSAPTLALVNQAGTDRSSRLDSTTGSLVSTGRYRWIYTADAADALEQLVWTFTLIEGGATRLYGNQSLIVDTTAVDFTAADRTKLETLAADYTTARAAKLDNLDATMTSRATNAGVAAQITADHGSGSYVRNTEPLDATQTQDAAAAALGQFDPPTRTEATSDKNEILAAVAALNTGAGSGARIVTITVTDDTDEPIQNAAVRLTLAAESFVQRTDPDGQAVFAVDDGTWALAITKPLFTFTPSTIVVDGDETRSFEMIRVALPAPEDVDQTTAFLTTYDAHGLVAADIQVAFRVVRCDGEAGRGYLSEAVVATSNETGLLTVTLLKNTTYRATLSEKVFREFTTDDSDSFAIPELVGLAAVIP